ncbi:hypothetical protein CBM2587_A30064 [Cupriavidus taiwanensis]|uniref:Uncharacterized protein n=1 Tax=Cupriavidus taiwanensis TaxID=164546 RepID=A0A375BTN5_9BURK|nr:hypothetical protein CBM2587_A30064 [Cupriavidus taiwanensis]
MRQRRMAPCNRSESERERREAGLAGHRPAREGKSGSVPVRRKRVMYQIRRRMRGGAHGVRAGGAALS